MSAILQQRIKQEIVTIPGKKFRPGEVLVVDGYRFVDCEFEGCILVYQGLRETQFINCRLRSVDWRFDGPAANSLNFLNMLAHAFGEDGRRLVQDLFQTLLEKPVLPEGSLVAEINAEDTAVLGSTEQVMVRKIPESK